MNSSTAPRVTSTMPIAGAIDPPETSVLTGPADIGTGLVPNAITPIPTRTNGAPSMKQIILIQCDGTNSQLIVVTSSENTLPISATAEPTSATLDALPAMNDSGMPKPGIHDSHSCSPDVSPVVETPPAPPPAAAVVDAGTLPLRNFL